MASQEQTNKIYTDANPCILNAIAEMTISDKNGKKNAATAAQNPNRL